MALSDVKIANRALQKLGARRIEELSENSPNGRSMNTAFVPVRDALLRLYNWNFAIKRVSVPALAAQTVYGNLNRFPLPDDFARLIRSAHTSGVSPGIGSFYTATGPLDIRHDWQIEGDNIVTADSAPLMFRYIAEVTDPTLFDPLFDEAFAANLAFETVEEITQSNEKKDALARELRRMIDLAKNTNAIENDAQMPPEDDWLIARL